MWIHKRVIRLGEECKLLTSFGVWIEIRVTFSRRFPVGRFNFGLRRIRLDAQYSVVVDHCASLNSESQRWMPGLSEDTASLARKVYHRRQAFTVRFLTSAEMSELALGGAKGEPGKIPRAAFEGARTYE